MKKSIKIVLPLLLIAGLLCSCSVQNTGSTVTAPQAVSIPEKKVKKLIEIEPYTETDTFSIETMGNIVMAFASENERVQSTVDLAVTLFNATEMLQNKITFADNLYEKHPGDIVLIESSDMTDEAYKLVIAKNNIYLYCNPSGNCNGLLYGLQDILKLCLHSEGGVLRCGESSFLPDTGERVLMLDCARKCWSVGWIKNLISEMSWMGFNALELHLTEEQGIRADIWHDKNGKAVPDCNGNDFSALCGGTIVSWNEDYHEDVNATYSRDDIIAIIEWANTFHIDIIPSVDLPGHSKNLIVRCEKAIENGFSFNYNGKACHAAENEKIAADGSHSNTVNIASEFARNLSYAVTEAYAAFFKDYGCDRFDIASDEVSVDDDSWADYAGANGGSTMFDGYVVYVNSLCDILKKMGYAVRANNDFLFSEKPNIPIDKDLQVCYWNPTNTGYGSAEYLVGEGRTMFNSIVSYCYYALRQSGSGYDARSPECEWWDFHHSTAKRVFCGCGGQCGFSSCKEPGGWNPSKMWSFNNSNHTTVTGSCLGGAYMYIWGDWAGWDTEENIFYRQDELGLVPRMWAISMKMLDWDADEAMTWDGFEEYISEIEYSPCIVK